MHGQIQSKRHFVSLLSIKASASVVVRFTGPIRGAITHWQGKRSIPCEGAGTCRAEVHKLRSVWKGYAPVEQWDGDQRLWLPMALECTSNLEEALRGQTLRGQSYLLSRDATRDKQGPVNAVFVEQWESVGAAIDVQAVLDRMYHPLRVRLDVPNTTPGRVVAEPIADRAPVMPSILQPPAPPVHEKTATRIRDEIAKAYGGSPSKNGQH